MEGAKANDDEFSFRFLNVEMVVRNSTTGEIAKFWQGKGFGKDSAEVRYNYAKSLL